MDKQLIGLLPQEDGSTIVTYDAWHVGTVTPVGSAFTAAAGNGPDAEPLGDFTDQDAAVAAVIQATT